MKVYIAHTRFSQDKHTSTYREYNFIKQNKSVLISNDWTKPTWNEKVLNNNHIYLYTISYESEKQDRTFCFCFSSLSNNDAHLEVYLCISLLRLDGCALWFCVITIYFFSCFILFSWPFPASVLPNINQVHHYDGRSLRSEEVYQPFNLMQMRNTEKASIFFQPSQKKSHNIDCRAITKFFWC